MLDLQETEALFSLLASSDVAFADIQSRFLETFAPPTFARVALAIRCLVADNFLRAPDDSLSGTTQPLVAYFLLDLVHRRSVAAGGTPVPNTQSLILGALEQIQAASRKPAASLSSSGSAAGAAAGAASGPAAASAATRPTGSDARPSDVVSAWDVQRATTGMKLFLLHTLLGMTVAAGRTPAYYFSPPQHAFEELFKDLGEHSEALKNSIDGLREGSASERAELKFRQPLSASARTLLPTVSPVCAAFAKAPGGVVVPPTARAVVIAEDASTTTAHSIVSPFVWPPSATSQPSGAAPSPTTAAAAAASAPQPRQWPSLDSTVRGPAMLMAPAPWHAWRFTPEFARPLPPAVPLGLLDAPWIAPFGTSDLRLDPEVGTDAATLTLRLRTLSAAADRLTPQAAGLLQTALTQDTSLAVRYGLSPEIIPGLVTSASKVTGAALAPLAPLPVGEAFVKPLLSDISIGALDVVKTLALAGLGIDLLSRYVLHICAAVEDSRADGQPARHARVVCAFLTTLESNGALKKLSSSVFAQILAFATQAVQNNVQQAPELYKKLQALQNQVGNDAGGAS